MECHRSAAGIRTGRVKNLSDLEAAETKKGGPIEASTSKLPVDEASGADDKEESGSGRGGSFEVLASPTFVFNSFSRLVQLDVYWADFKCNRTCNTNILDLEGRGQFWYVLRSRGWLGF